jgi:CheY-like chemotaxis protein
LNRWGLLADMAHCGQSALEALAAPGPAYDAIIVDRNMPVMDGLEFGEAVRRIYADAAPKLILWSSSSNASTKANAAASKIFDASLYKPVQTRALCETLAALFEMKKDQPRGPLSGQDASAGAILSGARILLVEDNETNQYAATTLLRQLGCQVELAENGRIAIDKCTLSAYDLILMDMQMPELDGIAATKIIRAQSNPNQFAPILALTANAFVEDAERCRAAGMNEHLTKPLRKAVLAEALTRHLSARKMQTEAQPQSQTQALDASAWDILLEDFGVDGVRRLAETFETQQGEDLAAMSPDDRKDLKRRAHSLKGSARLFGAGPLADMAARLEEIAVEAPTEEVVALAANLHVEFAAACREIKAKLAA